MTVTAKQIEELRTEVIDEHTFGPAWATMRELGVIRDGHYWTKDQRHTPYYYDTRPLFLTGRILTLVRDLPGAIHDIQIRRGVTMTAGPQYGGDIIALHLANLLEAEGPVRTIHSVPIEKLRVQTGKDLWRTQFNVREYFQPFLQGAKVLLVDTVRFTDKTMKTCAGQIEKYGGEVVASVSLIDASIVEHPRPHFSIWKQKTEVVYAAGPSTCPQCRKGVAMTEF